MIAILLVGAVGAYLYRNHQIEVLSELIANHPEQLVDVALANAWVAAAATRRAIQKMPGIEQYVCRQIAELPEGVKLRLPKSFIAIPQLRPEAPWDYQISQPMQ